MSSEAGYKAGPKELRWEKQEMATVKRKESRQNSRRDDDKSGPWGLVSMALQQKTLAILFQFTFCTERDFFHPSQLKFTYLDTLYMYVTF